MMRKKGRPKEFFGETRHTHFELPLDHWQKLNLLGKKHKNRTRWLRETIEQEYRKEFLPNGKSLYTSVLYIGSYKFVVPKGFEKLTATKL